MEDQYIRAHHSGSSTEYIWNLQGQEDFETLTLTPSIDASASGHWHGYIRNGQIE